MRNILTILFSFLAFSLFSQAECIDGLGHVKYRDLYSLRDTTGLTYSFDTTYVVTEIESVNYTDSIEWVIVPAGWDTLVWQCERCDSIQFDPSTETKFVSRIMGDPDKPEIVSSLDSIAITPAPGGGTYTRTVTVLTSSGTWTKPDSLLFLEVICIGGGGGACSGEKKAASVVSRGGGGAGAGSISWGTFLSSELDATEVYTVGAGGTGGASVTANSTTYNAGTAGRDSYFGGTNLSTSLVFAAGGKESSSYAGASNNVITDNKPGSTFPGLGGGYASSSGAAASSHSIQNTSTLYNTIYGGGGAGGITSANVASAGVSGSRYYDSSGTLSNDNKGAIGTNGTDGVDYYMDRLPYIFGSGHYEDIDIGYGTPGGGGGSSVTGNAGKGGNGGNYGGAGGGGGAARDSTGNSGAGGNGGAGVIILIEHTIE